MIRPYVLLLLFRNVPGVYIKDLIPGSVASLDGQLQIDDRILEVNSDDLSILSQEHAANHIQVHIFKFLIKCCRHHIRCRRYCYKLSGNISKYEDVLVVCTS